MAEFDVQQAHAQAQAHQTRFEHDQARMMHMENTIAQMSNALHTLQTVPPPVPPPQFYPNLNLTPPPPFSGSPLALPTFKMKLIHFLVGNQNTYPDSERQILYAGQLLEGPAHQWYQAMVDPNTSQLHPSYDIHRFLAELEEFFGGAVTLHSRERSLDLLRQTGSVSDLAIAFQNITHTFNPRWPDHPLIYLFSRKLKEAIRYELFSRGSLPSTFSAYVAAAISVEQNQANAASSRSQPSSQLPPRPPPRSLPLPAPLSGHQPSSGGLQPMDVDGTRGFKGALTMEERRRRSDAGLCAYCGQPGHTLATCALASRSRQARGTYQHLPLLPPSDSAAAAAAAVAATSAAAAATSAAAAAAAQYPAGYPPVGYPPVGYPPAGFHQAAFPFQGPFPGPWTPLPPPFLPQSPHTTFDTSSLPKNGHPSQ